MNGEGLADLFYDKLRTSTNPGVTLAQFYSAITGKQVGRSEIIKFNMLVKIFGKSSPFFAILDVSRREDINDFPYGLLFKICKDRLESSLEAEITISSFSKLDRLISDTQKMIPKVKPYNPDKAIKLLDRKDD